MMDGLYILENDVPVPATDLRTWAAWFEKTGNNRRLALTVVSPGVEVSTVFLGIDHGFGGESHPILWETMVFGGPYDADGERYATAEKARAGHERWVSKCRTDRTDDAPPTAAGVR